MEFKQLRSFIEVVHRGGFTQAAHTLHISQSAVSKQVAQLEEDLGQPLLERQGSQLHLTAAGRIVLERGEALFASLFAEYRRRYPNITVHLVEGGSRIVEQGVRSGELELGGSVTPSDPAFDYQPFCNEPLDALLPDNHPLAERDGVTLRQLADTPFLLYHRSFMLNDKLLSACEQAGFTPKEGGRSGQADFLTALVAAGQGVVLLPSVVARGLERDGVVRVPLVEPGHLRWDIAFIWRRGAYLSRAAQAWLALVQERKGG